VVNVEKGLKKGGKSYENNANGEGDKGIDTREPEGAINI